jgi:hypothetical protein
VASSGQASRHPLTAGRGPLLRNLRKRTVAVGILFVAAFVGVGTSGYRLTQHGPLRGVGGLVFGCLELVLLALLLMARRIRRQAPEPSYMIGRVRLFLHRTIVGAMVVVLAVVVSSLVWPGLKKYYGNPIVNTPDIGPNMYFRRFAGLSRAEVEFFIIAGVAVVVCAIMVAIVMLLRRRAMAAAPGRPVDDDGASLRQAVESGLRALHSTQDTRAAIIACYLTMEESLGAAGAARTGAETSTELLNKAVRAGLLHGPAANQLTLLFYEARYSSHELPPGARQDAERALEAISADLQADATAGRQANAAVGMAAS